MERTEADWTRMEAEIGRLFGRLVTYERVIAELQLQLAQSQDALQKQPVEGEGATYS